MIPFKEILILSAIFLALVIMMAIHDDGYPSTFQVFITSCYGVLKVNGIPFLGITMMLFLGETPRLLKKEQERSVDYSTLYIFAFALFGVLTLQNAFLTSAINRSSTIEEATQELASAIQLSWIFLAFFVGAITVHAIYLRRKQDK